MTVVRPAAGGAFPIGFRVVRTLGLVMVPAALVLTAGCQDLRSPDESPSQTAEGRSTADSSQLPLARPLTDRNFEATPARLERGRYLAENVTMCIWCHSERDSTAPGSPPLEGREGSGRVVSEEEGFRMVASNLTPDTATGAGSWSDDALARAIREGVGHDGRALARPMYWRSLRALHEEDLASVIVYLRSLPAVRNPLPARSLPPEWLAGLADDPRPLTEPVLAPDASDPVEWGRYLIDIADCEGCHTSHYTERMPGAYGGGNCIGNPSCDGGSGDLFTTNITHDSSGIGLWGEQTFIQVMRTGKGGTLDDRMPWAVFGGMTDEDLSAIYRALGEAPPARHWIDNISRPTYCPVCGQEHGLGELNRPAEAFAVPVAEALLSDYEGSYEGVYPDGEPYAVEIRLREGRLRVIEAGYEPEETLPLSETRFFNPGSGETIEFERDDSGVVLLYRARFGLDEWPMRRVRSTTSEGPGS